MENVLLGTLIPTEGRVLFPQKILSALVILNMEKTMVAEVISELKSISRLKIFEKLKPVTDVFRPQWWWTDGQSWKTTYSCQNGLA